MIFCGVVAADTTTVSGTLDYSTEIINLSTTESLGAATVNVEKNSTLDPFNVNANTGWTIQVYGAKLASDSPSDTATNAMKIYYNNAGNGGPTSSATLSGGTGAGPFSGDSGPNLPRAIMFGQNFTWDDIAGGAYSSIVHFDIAPNT